MPPTLSPRREQDKPKLLDQVRDTIRRKHYSIRTEQSYIDWIRRVILSHHNRHPSEMREAEVNAFRTHLARAGGVAASTHNQASSAWLFACTNVVKKELGWLQNGENAAK